MGNKCVVVFVGPSGIGKTSNARLLSRRFNFARSICITTSPPWDDDDEECCRYVDKVTFLQMIKRNQFIEWDQYGDNFYGTTWESIRLCDKPDCPGLVICSSPAGYPQIKSNLENVIGISLLPESGDIAWLNKKLKDRGTNSPDDIEVRTKILESYIHETKNLELPTVYLGYEPETWERAFTEIIEIIKQAGFKISDR